MLFDYTSSLSALIANGNMHWASSSMMQCIRRAHCGMGLVSTSVHPATVQRCPALSKSLTACWGSFPKTSNGKKFNSRNSVLAVHACILKKPPTYS